MGERVAYGEEVVTRGKAKAWGGGLYRMYRIKARIRQKARVLRGRDMRFQGDDHG
ncbi:MAG: hypothetical protein ABFE07_01940 [Armatimonadia bacterium]